jgi:hypothetical protein
MFKGHSFLAMARLMLASAIALQARTVQERDFVIFLQPEQQRKRLPKIFSAEENSY